MVRLGLQGLLARLENAAKKAMTETEASADIPARRDRRGRLGRLGRLDRRDRQDLEDRPGGKDSLMSPLDL